MKIIRSTSPLRLAANCRLLFAALSVIWTALAVTSAICASEAPSSDAEAAWKDVLKSSRPPATPAEWQTNRPSDEEILKFKREQGNLAGKAASIARDFYTRFPKDDKADEAHKKEYEMTSIAVQLGNTNLVARLDELDQQRLNDPKLSEDERFQLRIQAAQRTAMGRQSEGMAAVMAEFEKSVRVLQKDYPKRPEIYGMLLEVASNSQGEKSRKLAQEIADSSASEEIKDGAKGLLKKLDALGKPLNLKYTAVDGREVDVSKLAGKVVLVDFWATWCGPCVAELPNVKAAYEKLHPKGLEIAGISFDQEKDSLQQFVAKQEMPWPQYFDGAGWQNKFGREFGINSIPAMWLLDKKGVLRDMNAREDLEGKVEKLLAE